MLRRSQDVFLGHAPTSRRDVSLGEPARGVKNFSMALAGLNGPAKGIPRPPSGYISPSLRPTLPRGTVDSLLIVQQIWK